jgi:hypothetical protein
LPIVFDERFFGDTIFRAEKISKDTFVISDIIYHNSNYIFEYTNFTQRYDWLKLVLERFHTPIEGITKLIHKSNLPKVSLRGYEVYTDVPGSTGFFVEDSKTVTRGEMPDVYLIEESYVNVYKKWTGNDQINWSKALGTKGFASAVSKYRKEIIHLRSIQTTN